MTTTEQDIIKKAKNQILGLVISALCTGIGMNVLFISSINSRFETQKEMNEKRFDKVDRNIETLRENIIHLYEKK